MVASRSHIRTQVTWIAMMDLACLIAGALSGVSVRLGLPQTRAYVLERLEGWLLLFGGILLANYLAGSYRLQYTFSRFNLVVTWLFSLIFAVLILSMTSYAWVLDSIGRGALGLTLLFYSLLSLTLKLLLYRYLFRSQIFLCRAVIIGTGERAASLRRVVESDYVMPAHKVVANICVQGVQSVDPPADPVVDGIAVLNASIDNVDALIRSLGVTLIIVGLDDVDSARMLYPKLKRLRFEGIEVLSPLSVYEIYRGISPLELASEESLMQATLESKMPLFRRVKRLIDILASVLALILLFPVSLLIAIVVKVEHVHGPVFYTQTRVGQFGRQFAILKFRTMRPEAEKDTGPIWAADQDQRITRVGRFLRRFRLDEIPQFLNILRGEMSLVGPRPERPEIIRELEESIPFFSEREIIQPGLTGWAQIRYPYAGSIDDARRKLEYDLFYVKHLSLSLDLQVILSTLRIVLLGKERMM